MNPHRIRVALGLTAALLAPVVVTVAAPAVPVHAACTISLSANFKAIAPGAVNGNVVCLEQRLIELGYGSIAGPDTTYGTSSVNAVKAFQISRGMHPTGWVTSTLARQMAIFGGPMPPANAPKVTIIGDSTSAAMRWYDEANYTSSRYDVMGSSYDLVWSLESCRRLVVNSCQGRADTLSGLRIFPTSTLPLMQTTLAGKLGQAVVIMAGYDDTSITNAIDPIMAEAKKQGVAKVFWLNYRVTNRYNAAYQYAYPAHNANLEAAKVRHPNLVVLDWNGYTYSQSQATQSAWFSSDQIHITGQGATALALWLKGKLDAYNLQRCNAVNANTGAPDNATGTSTATTGDTGFTGLTPTRMLDTRSAAMGGANGRVGAGRRVTVNLSGVVPPGTEAVSLSVVAVDPCRAGYLTVFDCDVRPNTANSNFAAGRTTAALAVTPIGDGGDVCIYSSAATDLVVDITGVFRPDGDRFHAMPPTRWVDTRGDINALLHPILGPRGPGSTTQVQIRNVGSVPSDATAVWLNLVGVGVTANTFLTVYPGPQFPGECGPPPTSANVNVFAGRSAGAAVLSGLGPSGSVCIAVGGGTAYLVVDVAGWFSPASDGLVYHAGPLTRLYDSRPAFPAAGTEHQVTITDVSLLNVASVGSSPSGFVSMKPCGVTNTSALINNFLNETTANATAVAPGDGSKVCITASMATDVVVDRLGQFVVATS